jgi:uncharacterized protein YbaA (DUF1428 family)
LSENRLAPCGRRHSFQNAVPSNQDERDNRKWPVFEIKDMHDKVDLFFMSWASFQRFYDEA